MGNTIRHRQNSTTATTDRKPSASIWSNCPWDEINDPRSELDGITFEDDFKSGGLITSPTTEAALVGVPYSGFGSSGAAITHGDYKGGSIVLTEATDNEAIYLKAETHPFQISKLLGKFWFEMRVKIGAVSDDNMGWIGGMFDTTAMTVIVPLSTANPPIFATTGNFVGFRAPEEDAGAVHTQYVADGVTAVTVQSTVHTFVADTYVKLGMVFDPDSEYRLYFFVDGVRQTSSKVIPDATGTDFPADVRLAPFVGHRMGATASSGVTTMDWWRAAQVFP